MKKPSEMKVIENNGDGLAGGNLDEIGTIPIIGGASRRRMAGGPAQNNDGGYQFTQSRESNKRSSLERGPYGGPSGATAQRKPVADPFAKYDSYEPTKMSIGGQKKNLQMKGP
jgi:hypothetical protein